MAEKIAKAFSVSGMHCSSCGLLIDEMIEDIDGVISSETDVGKATTTVTFDPSLVEDHGILSAITEAGYKGQSA